MPCHVRVLNNHGASITRRLLVFETGYWRKNLGLLDITASLARIISKA